MPTIGHMPGNSASRPTAGSSRAWMHSFIAPMTSARGQRAAPGRLTSTAAVDCFGRRKSLASSVCSSCHRCRPMKGPDKTTGRSSWPLNSSSPYLGGVSIRPGLVYGDSPAGMVGALVKISRLPIVPFIAAETARQFPVRDSDLAHAIRLILEGEDWVPEVFGIAQRCSVSFRELLEGLAASRSRRPMLVPVPWWMIYWSLRLAEAARLSLPLRSDSVLGLVRPAEVVPSSSRFQTCSPICALSREPRHFDGRVWRSVRERCNHGEHYSSSAPTAPP